MGFFSGFFLSQPRVVFFYLRPLVPWSPVPWAFGPLVPWSPGPLVLWSSGPLVPWSSGPLVPWSPGPPVPAGFCLSQPRVGFFISGRCSLGSPP